MPKKLDLLHYILLLLLGGTMIMFFTPIEEHIDNKKHEDEKSFLRAKSSADSLVIVGDYDKALMQFTLIDSVYPDRIYLPAAKAMINQQKEERMAYMAFQEIQPKRKVKRIHETHLNSEPIQTLENDGIEDRSDASEDVIEDALDAEHNLDHVVKEVLHINLNDGAEVDYIGEVKNGMAHGFGFAIFEKRGFYEGEWKNNLRDGEGTYHWQNGDVYKGSYSKGKRNGYGVYTFATGDIYKGEWKDDLREGEGILYNKKGKVLTEGPWLQDHAVPTKKKKKKH